jgi:hypothetical protein
MKLKKVKLFPRGRKGRPFFKWRVLKTKNMSFLKMRTFDRQISQAT